MANCTDDDGNANVPTATLRELFIFNEAYNKREEIWPQVASMLRADPDEGSTGDEPHGMGEPQIFYN